MLGTIFNIQRFSVNDGPGIRTTVFLKGCPLHCVWCHNPESISRLPELSFDAKRCVSCGTCFTNCPRGCHSMDENRHVIDRAKCIVCGDCTRDCVSGALERIGTMRAAEEVIADVLRDAPFFVNSGGGITVSGGEPLFQSEFSLELLKLAKAQNISTAIETCGFAAWKHLNDILPYTDWFLYDIKESNEALHRQFTGAPLGPIRENLRRLNDTGARIILRCPLIPGYNVRRDHFEDIARLAESLKHVERIELEPYHPLGASKAQNLGRTYTVDNENFTDYSVSNAWLEKIRSLTSVPVSLA
jgi:glycyl-radical enzyme activating protein